MPQELKPTKLIVRPYQVGFGDCFLLTFLYPKMQRHVLIDFGSTGMPATANANQIELIALDIAQRCNGKLHAVVGTHRHMDHISGFARNGKKRSSGNIIASLNPDVVVQPWTEDPRADPKTGALIPLKARQKSFLGVLNNMHRVAAVVRDEAARRQLFFGKGTAGQLTFLGNDNLKNLSAVRNLMTMGKRAVYVHYGSKSGLEKVLPGVKTMVLGPPNIEQSQEIRKQRRTDPDEFWHFHSQAQFWFSQAQAAKFVDRNGGAGSVPFLKASVYSTPPPFARWFVKRMQRLRGYQLLGIMRALDNVMNNTSVILLFEAGRKKFLFPGDAQIENWSYALSKPEIRQLLQTVNLYKVGHHGSLNATPKTLWKLFRKRSCKKRDPNRLRSVLSTMAGKHGRSEATAVPRKPLVEALEAESYCFNTQHLRGKRAISFDEVNLEFDL